LKIAHVLSLICKFFSMKAKVGGELIVQRLKPG
jgi:hypothetical protein